MRTSTAYLLAWAYLMTNNVVHAQVGILDPSFGQGDTVLTPILSSYDRTEEVLVQPDGRIIVVGSTYDNGATGIALARYESDGTLDTTFGDAGVRISFTTDSIGIDAAAAVLLSDGRILVAGNAAPNAYIGLLARYTTDGDLDPTFGTGGLV
ncbi:MAG TPA: delta-60 repeat domain-containing protein, partial [Flavobacteriales bacterium]|nr:delta-60 repeat domain-containing protein [Flavobacteriales bacterium]